MGESGIPVLGVSLVKFVGQKASGEKISQLAQKKESVLDTPTN